MPAEVVQIDCTLLGHRFKRVRSFFPLIRGKVMLMGCFVRFLFLILLAFASVAHAQQKKPQYRCLAPFVWSIDANRQPANLFEVFLQGPFDRVDEASLAGRGVYDAGWAAVASGDDKLAARCFRQVWEDTGNGDALVAMALLYLENKAVTKIFGAAASGKCESPSWNHLATQFSIGGIETEKDLEKWCLSHDVGTRIRLFITRRALDRGDMKNYPAGFATLLDSFLEKEESGDWMRLRLAEETQIFPDSEELSDLILPDPNLHLVGMRVALAKGDLALSRQILDGNVRGESPFPPGMYRLAVDLAWRLDRDLDVKNWIQAWVQEASFSEEGRANRMAEVAAWQERAANPQKWEDLGEVESFLLKYPGHVRARVQKIRFLFDAGRTRDALFEIDSELRGTVRWAGSSQELEEILSPDVDARKWAPGLSRGTTPHEFAVPMPLGLGEPVSPPMAIKAVDGKSISFPREDKKSTILLFYTGVGCPACQIQLQAFNRKAAEWKDLGMDVIAISAQDSKGVSDGLKQTGVDFPFVFAGDPELEAFQALGMYDSFAGYPMHGVVVLDGAGKVRWASRSYEPYTDVDFLAEEITRLFSRN